MNKMTLVWILGYRNIVDNEFVNKLAGKGSETSFIVLVPNLVTIKA